MLIIEQPKCSLCNQDCGIIIYKNNQLCITCFKQEREKDEDNILIEAAKIIEKRKNAS